MVLYKDIVQEQDLIVEQKRRSEKYDYIKVDFNQVDTMNSNGWQLVKKYKTFVKFRKEKLISDDEAFENQIWLLFFKLGFTYLNKGRKFILPYSEKDGSTKQIDVFAADDESALIVECKAANTLEKKVSFKTEIEALGGRKQGIIQAVKKLFSNKKLKVGFIFATKNYAISSQDKERMSDFGIIHFDEDVLTYYDELYNHLGLATRYQLLGNIFAGQKIPEMHNVVPAIEGEMGKQIYYSFSIEPDKLLKLGFVLHHDKANKNEMPAYQRIIKKSRLKAVQEYINGGGFFPNSIIINIVSKKELRFDKANLQDEKSLSKIGLLYLPQEYKSVYIIDGQHRLYGYSNSQWKQKNTIPVVAFVNLKLTDQIKMFMDINENQKAVPKNLRTTLEANLLWDAKDYNDRRKAISSRIAQKLGEDKNSALYGRIITGENSSTPMMSITLDYISKSLKSTNFYNIYKNNVLIKDGTIDKGCVEDTYDTLYRLLLSLFDVMETLLHEDWDKGTNDEKAVICNTFIYAYIRIFSDIIDYLIKYKNINVKGSRIDDIVDIMNPYLNAVAIKIEGLSGEEREGFRKQYGRVGDNKLWRTLQLELHKNYQDFNPDGMEEFWKNNSMRYNEEAYKLIMKIELKIKEKVISALKKKYGENWLRQGCPKDVYDNANKLASDKNYTIKDGEPLALPEDQLHLIEYRDIMIYSSNWSELFENVFSQPTIKGDKKKKTEWLQKLNTIRNKNAHTYSITEEEYEFLLEISKWLLGE